MAALRIVILALTLGVTLSAAHAQGGLAVTFPPGWNMVGAPPGTDLSSAEALEVFSGGRYSTPSAAQAAACQGYWAYFSSATSVVLPVATAGPEETCSLQPGWNMLANPFTDTAPLPSDLPAYRWDPLSGAYRSVTVLAPGTAAWLYVTKAGSITLKPTAGATSKLTITFTGAPPSSPYQVHVGDLLTLKLPTGQGGQVPYTASADPSHLQLEALGLTGSATAPQPYYTWVAYVPGSTALAVSPSCQEATPPCGQPSIAIPVQILP